jgi:hypothetical protein
MCAICDFKIDFDIDRPQAVATRVAIDAGTLPEKVFDGALASVKLRVAAIGAEYGVFCRRVSAA